MGEQVVRTFSGSDTKLKESLEDFCIRGLNMPQHLLRGFSRVLNMDAFTVHTHNDLSFTVSGPEIAQWEYRRGIHKVCSPGSDEVLKDD